MLIRARRDKKNEAHPNTSNAIKKHTQETSVAAHSKCQQPHKRKIRHVQIGCHCVCICTNMNKELQKILVPHGMNNMCCMSHDVLHVMKHWERYIHLYVSKNIQIETTKCSITRIKSCALVLHLLALGRQHVVLYYTFSNLGNARASGVVQM